MDAIVAKIDPQGCMFLSEETGECIGGTRPEQGADFFGWQQPKIDEISQDFAVKDFNKYTIDGFTGNF